MSAFAPETWPDAPANCFGCGRRTPPEDIEDYLGTTSGTEPFCEECHSKYAADGGIVE